MRLRRAVESRSKVVQSVQAAHRHPHRRRHHLDQHLRRHLKLGARYYNPTTARFTQPDPIAVYGDYAYAGDNPANYTDPTGLYNIKDWMGTVGTFAGGGAAIGSVVGCVTTFVAGCAPGAGVGAAYGGVAGATFGMGYGITEWIRS